MRPLNTPLLLWSSVSPLQYFRIQVFHKTKQKKVCMCLSMSVIVYVGMGVYEHAWVCEMSHKIHNIGMGLVYSTFPGILGHLGCVDRCQFWNLFKRLEFRSSYVQVTSNPLTVQDSYSCSDLPCMLVPVSSVSRKRSVCILSYHGCILCQQEL